MTGEELGPEDDRFHSPEPNDPTWTETSWWGFVVPEGIDGRPLGGMVYLLARPNLGVGALVTCVWDDQATESWRLPYHRNLWHEPLTPDHDLADLTFGPLRLRVDEPLQRYWIGYDEAGLGLDLVFDGFGPPQFLGLGDGKGHLDQAGLVTGTIRVGTDEVEVSCIGGRDRSWSPRSDDRSLRAGFTYGAVDASEHFFLHSFPTGDYPADDCVAIGGYLERDGVRSAIASGTRRVVSRRRGHPEVIELEATDAAGRTLEATGRTLASHASQSTPGMFAWMSINSWLIDGREGHGEDHDVWSPDHLARSRGLRLRE